MAHILRSLSRPALEHSGGHINAFFFASTALAPALVRRSELTAHPLSPKLHTNPGGREWNVLLACALGLLKVSQVCLYCCYLDDCFSNDAKQYFMLHASAHLPVDAALKDMVIELLLDVAGIALFSL